MSKKKTPLADVVGACKRLEKLFQALRCACTYEGGLIIELSEMLCPDSDETFTLPPGFKETFPYVVKGLAADAGLESVQGELQFDEEIITLVVKFDNY